MDSITMITAVIGACWGFKQWLDYQRGQKLADHLIKPRPDGTAPSAADADHIQTVYAEVIQSQQAATGGMPKWLYITLCLIYVVCPIDLIPDFIPVVGWGDDVAALVMAARKALS